MKHGQLSKPAYALRFACKAYRVLRTCLRIVGYVIAVVGLMALVFLAGFSFLNVWLLATIDVPDNHAVIASVFWMFAGFLCLFMAGATVYIFCKLPTVPTSVDPHPFSYYTNRTEPKKKA